jgi:hypothetical protein
VLALQDFPSGFATAQQGRHGERMRTLASHAAALG